MKVKIIASLSNLTMGKTYEVVKSEVVEVGGMQHIWHLIINDKDHGEWVLSDYCERVFENLLQEKEQVHDERLELIDVLVLGKDGDLYESTNPYSIIKGIEFKDWGIHFIIDEDIEAYDRGFGINNNTKFRLKKKEKELEIVSFQEALSAYESYHPIKSLVSKCSYRRNKADNSDLYKESSDGDYYYWSEASFEIEEIKGDWIILKEGK